MSWLGWMLIGAALGWLVGMLFDWFFWRNRRICTEDEAGLRKQIGELEGRIGAFDSERDEWNSRLAGMETDLAGYQAKVGGLETDKAELAAQVGNFDKERANWQARTGDVDTYRTKVAELENENLSLKGRVGDFEAKVGDLNAKLSSAELKAPTSTTSGISAKTSMVGAGVAGLAAAAAATTSGDNSAEIADAGTSIADGSTIKGDDLQKVWGIGPASEKVLHDNGISTYAQLCKSKKDDLRAMLDASGVGFNLVREDSWPEQACLADSGRWDELASMQDDISTAYVTSEFTGEFTGEKQDLTGIWGIGPAVEKVLYSKGVYRYDQLAGMPLGMLQGIIAAAGERFNLVEPELWIPQAKVAASGDMDALETLKKKISEENS